MVKPISSIIKVKTIIFLTSLTIPDKLVWLKLSLMSILLDSPIFAPIKYIINIEIVTTLKPPTWINTPSTTLPKGLNKVERLLTGDNPVMVTAEVDTKNASTKLKWPPSCLDIGSIKNILPIIIIDRNDNTIITYGEIFFIFIIIFLFKYKCHLKLT